MKVAGFGLTFTLRSKSHFLIVFWKRINTWAYLRPCFCDMNKAERCFFWINNTNTKYLDSSIESTCVHLKKHPHCFSAGSLFTGTRSIRITGRSPHCVKNLAVWVIKAKRLQDRYFICFVIFNRLNYIISHTCPVTCNPNWIVFALNGFPLPAKKEKEASETCKRKDDLPLKWQKTV